ncbi:MAG: PBECR4 domain-containing protein [Fusobacterium perfoetens]|uniref:PBECR4 domain-containing protein n=1 Tax=Fusobacterium perfoetens TaxID=852 RepID=UPI0023F0C000|nr:PBECR4 domain-containing protein [Fusobacterium perfoetens]MCI6152869.1 PBECR4 domain-containing protein [Fusobacterium perfoetens]MDY3237281.1 PBECR4 domain-containing protein [Fusobacterium perfoetens]
MDKRRLLESIKEAKEIFDNHLLNKNFLYVYKNTINEKIEFFEIKCNKSNFLHLTGVKTNLTSSLFYSYLDGGKLSYKDIDYKSNGTTRLKLEIFNRLPLLLVSPVQVSFQDNFFTLKLQVDIMLNRPNINKKDIILGLKKINRGDYFVPASLLKEEPKKIGKNFSRVLCIMEKSLDEKQYNIIKYKVKDMEIEEILNNIKSEKIF